jgi:hypothetical protein
VKSAREELFLLPAEKDLPPHPAAKAFEVLPQQVRSMVESLREHGQLHPVEVYEDKILDGQTRNLARKKLKLPLRCRRVTDLGGKRPLEWVIARNMASGTARQLNDSQRAIIGAKLCRDLYQSRGEKEQGRSHEIAARMVNVRPNRVRQGLKVIADSELESAVWHGSTTISSAAKIAELPVGKQRDEATALAKDKSSKAALRRLLKPAGKSVDVLRQEVPEELCEVFAAEGWNKAQKHLMALADWLRSMADHRAARILCEKLTAADIDAMRDTLASCRPWAVCPFCRGEGCNICHNSSWLSEEEYHRGLAAAADAIERKPTRGP